MLDVYQKKYGPIHCKETIVIHIVQDVGIYLVYPDIIHQTMNTRRTIIVFYFLIVFQLTFEIYKIIETIKQQLEIYG